MTAQSLLPVKAIKAMNFCRENNGTLVLVTGVFDLLHQEHINFLAKAAEIGDCLLIGVETDERVKKLKGEDRPVESQTTRVAKLTDLSMADAVFLLPKQFNTKKDHLNLIKLIKPDILAVSAGSPNLEQKKAIVAETGAEVRVVCPHNPHISTTQLLAKKII